MREINIPLTVAPVAVKVRFLTVLAEPRRWSPKSREVALRFSVGTTTVTLTGPVTTA